MDSLFQQLAAVEQDIKGLIDQRAALKKVERKQVIDSDQQEELVRLDMRLADARASAKRYESFIKLTMKEQEPEAMTFEDADEEWTQSVTGVNTSPRRWTSFVIDENIQPRPGFHTAFEEIRKGVHQFAEAGRRFFLNLFLLDIIHRPEFEGDLRLFPELELSVIETTGAKKRKLSGRTDYTIGFGKGKDILSKAIPREVHLVAVEAKTSIGTLDLLQCIAEAATLYKIHVDTRKPKKSVWGILSNAETWRFIFIDEAGLLWKSDTMIMPLDYYDESKVLQVYRMVYHMIKCCHEACTPPPSTASPVVSLNQ
ncbi:hypothetical protein MP228_006213 [Amoeboaphelidium protococcarum]|nr:hypothetical protein MP228_006213 [Amoeboaphelidium protococcarum]